MKPTGKRNYGSIPHLLNSKLGEGDRHIHEGQHNIMTIKKRDKHDLIRVFEKYDGSNVGIAKVRGQVVALTRSGYEVHTSPYEQHRLFSKWVEANKWMFEDMLNEGERICGEWLAVAHGIVYKIEDKEQPIVFYDFFNAGNERLIWFDTVLKTYDYPTRLARTIHCGKSVSVESLLPILNLCDPAFYPVDTKPEGMVYRVERKGKVDFLAKWVRSDFEAGKYIINVNPEGLIWNIKTKLKQ